MSYYYYASFDDNESDNEVDGAKSNNINSISSSSSNNNNNNNNKRNRPPIAKNAHKRPQSNSVKSVHTSSSNGQVSAKQRCIDPRFEPMLGKVDVREFENNYKFLREQQEDEQRQRLFRIKCLKTVIKRVELENSTANLEEYDLSDEEDEVFGDEHRNELQLLKQTPPESLYAELEQLQKECTVYTAQIKNKSSMSRKTKVKRELMHKELAAVKEGKKSKMFFPKRKELKKAVIADTFDKLQQSGGKAAVDRYVLRKEKRH